MYMDFLDLNKTYDNVDRIDRGLSKVLRMCNVKSIFLDVVRNFSSVSMYNMCKNEW